MAVKKIILHILVLLAVGSGLLLFGSENVLAQGICGRGRTQNIVGCDAITCEPILGDPIDYTCSLHDGVCSGWVETDRCIGTWEDGQLLECHYQFKDHYVWIPCDSGSGGGGGGGGGNCITETTHECKQACTGGWSPGDNCGSCKKGKKCCQITTCVSPTPTLTPSCQGYNYIDAPVSGTTFVKGNSNNISGWARFCSGPAGAGVRERDDIHSAAFCRSQT